RWRAPAAPQAWSEARPATAFGASCPQAALPQAPIRTTSEDCLFLNVWAPPGAQGKKLPVMVSIHGGGYTLGSGDLADTTSFTRDRVVMVSMNYRLGRLGHFAHPALTKEAPNGDLASFATMDQIAALEWVKSSIAA